MDFRFWRKSGRAADIAAMTEFDPVGTFQLSLPDGASCKPRNDTWRRIGIDFRGVHHVDATSSPDDKLTGDLGSMIETTQIGGRRPDRLMTGKLSPGNFGLLQQYLPKADSCTARKTRYGNCLIGNWLATWRLKAERAASFHKWLRDLILEKNHIANAAVSAAPSVHKR
jgi:hypothetical protein